MKIEEIIEEYNNTAFKDLQHARIEIREFFKERMEKLVQEAREEERKKATEYIEMKLKQLIWSEKDIKDFLYFMRNSLGGTN